MSKDLAKLWLVFVAILCIIARRRVNAKAIEVTSAEPLTVTTTNLPENKTLVSTSTLSTVQNQVENVTLKANVSETSSVEGSLNKGNATSSNYIIEYPPQVFNSPEDIKTQQEWGGNCTLSHWDKCKALESWFGNYEDPKDGEIKNYIIDCKLEPVVCLTNSWTVTRCNLLCMSRCNREIQFKYDKYVSHSGECKAHAHG